MGRVFANGPGDLGSIPGRVIPKTFKMVLDISLLSNISYVSRVKWSNPGNGIAPYPTLPLGVVATEKGAFWSPSTTVANLTFYFLFYLLCILIFRVYWFLLLYICMELSFSALTQSFLIMSDVIFLVYCVCVRAHARCWRSKLSQLYLCGYNNWIFKWPLTKLICYTESF